MDKPKIMTTKKLKKKVLDKLLLKMKIKKEKILLLQ